MKILVTGGAGFIGSTLVDHYVAAGHKVWAIDNESTGHRRQVNKKAKFARIDIQNKAALKRFFQGKKFDVVNHHAAQINVRYSVEDPVFDAKVNVLGSLHLLNLCKETKVKKFLFASSGGTIYGECTRGGKETDPEGPLSPYGVTKLATEKYIKTFSSLYGLKYTIFRYSNVYGPRQDPHGEAGVVAIFSEGFLKGKRLKIFGNGKQTRDFVYVGDVARASVLALTRATNQVVNIGIGREISVNQLYKTMAKIAGYKKPPVYKPARPGELNRSVLNIRHAQSVLKWRPKTTLEQGLRQTIAHFKNK